ncbi:amidohydrolase family protein [candidate division KSB1 bacterium]|nr:amidohydrolase family protein [candidate division KSB1 bacterium]
MIITLLCRSGLQSFPSLSSGILFLSAFRRKTISHPKHILRVADGYPDLNFVLAHLWWPKIDRCYELTRACPRIYYDLLSLADPEIIAAFGRDRLISLLTSIAPDHPHRLISGSDAAMCSREAHLRLVDALEVGEEVREGVLGGNTGKVYSLWG